ncbi:ribonuclease G, partial [Lujinxingia vulgaris]
RGSGGGDRGSGGGDRGSGGGDRGSGGGDRGSGGGDRGSGGGERARQRRGRRRPPEAPDPRASHQSRCRRAGGSRRLNAELAGGALEGGRGVCAPEQRAGGGGL